MLSAGHIAAAMRNRYPSVIVFRDSSQKSQSDWELLDYSGGCLRKAKLQCGKGNVVADGERDRFLGMPACHCLDISSLR